MTESIGWGLIGASRIAADSMIGAIRAQGDSDVVAVMSSNPEWGDAYARQHRHRAWLRRSRRAARRFGRGRRLYQHHQRAPLRADRRGGAEAGKHVLCEKPLALTVADGQRMVEACAAAGVQMGTNHHLRSTVGLRAIRDIVGEGRIGQVRSARICFAIVLPERFHDWRLNDRDGGGPILDLGVHLADSLRFLLDDEPQDVVAQSVNHGLTVPGLEDEAMSVVRMRGGALVHLFPSWAVTYTEADIEILGSEGFVHARHALMPHVLADIVLGSESGRTTIDLEDEPCYERVVRLFNAAIRGEGEPHCTGRDGVRSLALALAIREAAATGSRVAVET